MVEQKCKNNVTRKKELKNEGADKTYYPSLKNNHGS